MDENRKLWNTRQKELRTSLSFTGDFQKAISLFLDQHAMVHSAKGLRSELWSFEDDVLGGLSDNELRFIPAGEEHSIAWVLWHLTRVEDVTMNILVAGKDQLFLTENWYLRTKYNNLTTGNDLDTNGIIDLSNKIDLQALQDYRLAVASSTRRHVLDLLPTDMSRRVLPDRLEKLREEATIVESTRFLLDYWGNLTIAGILLMPPTRHTFIHLNEAAKIRRRLK
jgi:hypothetical protein